MTIRIATIEDSTQAIRLLLKFHKEAELPFSVNAAFALALFKSCVNDEDKIAIIKDGGILLGIVGNSLIGPIKQACEIAWYVDPEKRGGSLEMFKLYEKWATDQGAKLIEAKSLYKFSEVETLYKRLNYQPIEKSWVKVVN